jgi:TRAP-type C4-dicarboxylate transport system permease small subunit
MRSFLNWLSKAERIVALSCMGLMTLLVICDVTSRELFNQGLPWAQKTAVYFMIWGGFLGACLVTQKASHLRPEIADKLWSKSPLLFVRIQNIVSLFFCMVFCYAAFLYVAESREFGDKSVVLGVSLWLLQLIIPYTFLSMSLRHLFYLMHPSEQLKLEKELH